MFLFPSPFYQQTKAIQLVSLYFIFLRSTASLSVVGHVDQQQQAPTKTSTMSFISACSLARRLAGRQLRIRTGRTYASSSVEPSKEAPKSQPAADSGVNHVANLGSRTHAPNNFEKRLLVFTKKYKSTDEVPALIK